MQPTSPGRLTRRPLSGPSLTRRRALGLAAAAAAGPLLTPWPAAAQAEAPQAETGPAPAATPRRLTAAPSEVPLVGTDYPPTAVWAYDDRCPGPLLRYRQGETLEVELVNRLPQPTTLHWHGLRLPNAMDGVPDVTQPPVRPGERFRYRFALKDAGTFWYHPHVNASEQVGRGLAGALVVAEAEPPQVDREELWVLDDWRLDEQARMVGGFGENLHEAAHAGRIGNTVTLNGVLPASWPVRSGERVRLRLANVSNARTFGLRFEGHAPQIVALDGQPCRPHSPPDGLVVLGAGGRCDLILDLGQDPGSRARVVDAYYENYAYELLSIAYDAERPLRASPLDAPLALPDNPLPAPDLGAAEDLELVLGGGAMGQMMTARLGGESYGFRELAARGKVWALNGQAHAGPDDPPLFSLQRGRSYRLRLVNRSSFEHPMHLHGHHLKLLARDGRPVEPQPWHDTLLIAPGETVDTAFVAETPGRWMFHCHVLEHQLAGMMGTLDIA